MTITPYEEWLALGMAGRSPRVPIPPDHLARYFIRFNKGISSIRIHWDEEELARAIWHLYGSGSCHFSDLSYLPPSPLVDDLFASLESLYRDLFEACCTPAPASHQEAGSPLDGACHRLWTMDCGLDSFWISGEPRHVDLTLSTLARLGRGSSHAAVLESVIHGLDALMDDYPAACKAILEELLRRDNLDEAHRNRAIDAIYQATR